MYRFCLFFVCCACLFDIAFAQQEPVSNQTILSMQSVERQAAHLKAEREELEKSKDRTEKRARCSEDRNALKAKLEEASEISGIQRDFIRLKLSLVAQDCQILSEIDYLDQQYKTLLDQNIELLKEYRADPEFKNTALPVKASYGFDEFEESGRRLFSIKGQLANLEKSRIVASDDLAKRKKADTALEEERREKTKQQEEFSPAGQMRLSPREQGELVDLQKQILDDKKTLITAKLREAERRIFLLDTHIMILRLQQAVLSVQYDRIKKALYIDISYVRKAEATFEKNSAQAALESEKLRSEVKKFQSAKEAVQKKKIDVAKKLNISATDLAALGDWSKKPENAREWKALCALGPLTFEEILADLNIEYKQALILLEKTKIDKEKTQLSIIKSWYVLMQRRLGFSSRELERQIKSYEVPKNELQGDSLILIEKRMRVLALLQEFNATSERLKKRAEEFREKNAVDIPSNQNNDTCAQKIRSAEEQSQRCLYLAARLIETYSNAIALIEDAGKRVENVVAELKNKSFWRRSDQSITLEGLINFIPDIRRFFDDVSMGLIAYKQTLTMQAVHKKLADYYGQPLSLLFLLLRLIIALLIFGIFYFLLPRLKSYLMKKPDHRVHSALNIFAAGVTDFLRAHLVGLYIWTVLYLLIFFEIIANVYFSLFFYFLSIPYMLFIARRFIKYILEVNKKSGYHLIGEAYESRFRRIVPALAYATIVIFFFRKAFMLGNYTVSAVPSVLLTLNFIILQLALMGLIGKDWILGLISRTTPSREWFYDVVDNYYYLFWSILIAIIVMSNPYVGYGRQVLYVLSRIFILGILVLLLLYVYKHTRKFSARLFFYQTENEAAVERFASARTWYGLFIVFSFCLLFFLGILATLKALGYPLTLSKISDWLHYGLYRAGSDELGHSFVTPLAFLKLGLIFLSGLVIAYIINRLLLRYIFDPLLISSGIQNSIFTFTRYILILITLLIGMKSVGLESFATKFVLVIGAIGFVVKEPILDFFSYFIILVQRPIKIGDLIMLDENIRGVVRHMTLRSVILRKDNSLTVIVPNSHIITKPVANWTHSAFLGIDDIVLSVSYANDPQHVRRIIRRVLDANPYILKKPAPVIRLTGFGEKGIEFLIRGFVTNDKALDRSDIASDIRFGLAESFGNEKISFAFVRHFVVTTTVGAEHAEKDLDNGSKLI